MKPKTLEIEVTQEAFDKLPALVPRSVFCSWSGLSSEELSEEVKQKRIDQWKATPAARKGKFFKWQLAQYCRLKVR